MIHFASSPDAFAGSQLSPVDRFTRYFLEVRSELLQFLSRRAGRAKAEDLVQDVWVRLRERSDPASWIEPRAVIFTVASNLAADDGRRDAREQARVSADQTLLESLPTSSNPSLEVESAERLERLVKALDELPEICREAFLLNRLDELTHAEIAATVGVSKKSVQRYIERALRHLLSACKE